MRVGSLDQTFLPSRFHKSRFLPFLSIVTFCSLKMESTSALSLPSRDSNWPLPPSSSKSGSGQDTSVHARRSIARIRLDMPPAQHLRVGAPLSPCSPLSPPASPLSPPDSKLQPPTSDAPTKKKKDRPSLFKFFSVKEPSSQALQQYEETLRKQQSAGRGNSSRSGSGRPSAVGMAMVSAAKLPPTVPKVNSKWEGVPDAMVERDKKARRASVQLRGRPATAATSQSGSSRLSRSSSRTSSHGRRTTAPYSTRRSSVLSFASSSLPLSRGSDIGPSSARTPPASPYLETGPSQARFVRPVTSRAGTDDGSRSMASSNCPTLLEPPSCGRSSTDTPPEELPPTPSYPLPDLGALMLAEGTGLPRKKGEAGPMGSVGKGKKRRSVLAILK